MRRATTTPMDTTPPLPFILTSPNPLMPPTILSTTLMAMFHIPWTMWRARPMVTILLDLSTITQDPSDPLDSMPISFMKNNFNTLIKYLNKYLIYL